MERIFCNDQIMREVASELGLSIETVRTMVNSQSEYTKLIIESNTFDFVRWPYLGIFKSKPKEIQMLQYLAGMTTDQGREFKKAVRTGKIRLDAWKDKLKKNELQRPTRTNGNIQDDNLRTTGGQGGQGPDVDQGGSTQA